MKHLFLFLLFLLPVLLSAQDPLPANPRKLRLGYQTDGEGIVLYGSGVPSYTPTRYRSAFHYMDTTNNIYYQYNRIEAKWDTILAGAGAVADGVSVDNSSWSKIGGTDVQQALTKTDSVLNNITIDGSQIQNKFEATTTTLTVSADTLLAKQDYVVSTRNTADTFRIVLPQITSALRGKTLTVVDSTVSVGRTYIEVDTTGGASPVKLRLSNGRLAEKYYPQNKTVRITQTDGVWVIDEDIPTVQKIEDELEFLSRRFHRGQVVSYNGQEYRVTTTPIDYTLAPQNRSSAISELSVDSVYVKPVFDAAPWGRQRILSSNSSIQFISSLADSLSFGGPPPVIDGNTYVWSYTNGTSTTIDNTFSSASTLIWNIDASGLEIGDTVTFSFKYAIGKTDANNSVRVYPFSNGVSGPFTYSDPDTTVRKWETVTRTWVTTSVVANTLRPRVLFYMEPGDTVYITQPQFVEGSNALDWRPTYNGSQGTNEALYAVLIQADAGVLDFDNMYFPPRYASTADRMQYAIDLCSSLGNCSEIRSSKNLYFDKGIRVPGGVNIRGTHQGTTQGDPGNETTGTTWYFDCDDPNAIGIDFYNQYDPTDYTNNTLEGINIIALSRMQSPIRIGLALRSKIKNVTIRARDVNNNNLAYTDSIYQYGITDIGGADGAYTKLDNVFVEDAYQYGYNFANNKSVVMERCAALRNWVGISGTSTGITANATWLEDNASTAIRLAETTGSGIYLFSKTYFENNTEEDSLANVIDISGASRNIVFEGVRVQGVQKPKGAFIKIRDSERFRLSTLGGAGFFPDTVLNADCSNKAIFLENIGWSGSAASITDAESTGLVCDSVTQYVNVYDVANDTYLTKFHNPKIVQLKDSDGDAGTDGQILSNASGLTDWISPPYFDGGSMYITDADPDTLDFSASGGVYQQIQDLQATALDNFTSLSDSLIYSRSLTRPFTLNFSVTLEGDTGSTFYNFEVKRNGTAITGCRVSEEYPSAGVEQNISGSCRVDLGDSDALTLEIMTPSASSQVIVRKANLTVH